MKKSLKIMAALLLISSVVGTTQSVTSVVNAEESSASADDNIAVYRADLEKLVTRGKEILAAPGSLSAATLEKIAAGVSSAQYVLDNNLESEYQSSANNLITILTNLEYDTESSSSESTPSESTSSESSSSESTPSESSSSGSTSSESSSSGSTSSESSSSESTSSESSSSEEATPTIEVSNQTVYVGQTLTEDMILGWATFKNADGYIVGFEVVGDPIQVTALGNSLVEPGTHTIRFYVSKPAQQRSTDNVVAEKVITLSVLPESSNPLNDNLPKEDTKTPATGGISQVTSPVANSAKKTINSGKTTAKQLPVTGEENNNMMIASAGVLLIAGAYLFRKKQLEK
ncbi:LPXTG cell wall anchor domain-containing protein [Enterococcus quebecensis]|uniref:LPXTG cell wall anchor domain-containing protein n=1 Tax=Enterococcus quebecensis TaxID=903983 RepID=UPI000915DC9C|nr:LPXTG cell wall anchor domain-containing protein [Enterococcus quebecensis]OJG73932.1 LPXTG-domain-containing protein cell wall anchor domain [Enterococcus quebecensis]